MLPDRVSNPRSLTYESGALPIALRGPALNGGTKHLDAIEPLFCKSCLSYNNMVPKHLDVSMYTKEMKFYPPFFLSHFLSPQINSEAFERQP